MTPEKFFEDSLDAFLAKSMNQDLNKEELDRLCHLILSDQDFRKHLSSWVKILREVDWPNTNKDGTGEK